MEEGFFAHFVKHSVQNVALGQESVGVEVWPQPHEDLLAHVDI